MLASWTWTQTWTGIPNLHLYECAFYLGGHTTSLQMNFILRKWGYLHFQVIQQPVSILTLLALCIPCACSLATVFSTLSISVSICISHSVCVYVTMTVNDWIDYRLSAIGNDPMSVPHSLTWPRTVPYRVGCSDLQGRGFSYQSSQGRGAKPQRQRVQVRVLCMSAASMWAVGICVAMGMTGAIGNALLADRL